MNKHINNIDISHHKMTLNPDFTDQPKLINKLNISYCWEECCIQLFLLFLYLFNKKLIKVFSKEVGKFI